MHHMSIIQDLFLIWCGICQFPVNLLYIVTSIHYNYETTFVFSFCRKIAAVILFLQKCVHDDKAIYLPTVGLFPNLEFQSGFQQNSCSLGVLCAVICLLMEEILSCSFNSFMSLHSQSLSVALGVRPFESIPISVGLYK